MEYWPLFDEFVQWIVLSLFERNTAGSSIPTLLYLGYLYAFAASGFLKNISAFIIYNCDNLVTIPTYIHCLYIYDEISFFFSEYFDMVSK